MSGGDGGDAGGPSGEIGASDGEGDRGEKGRQAGRQCGPWGEDIGAAHCGELSVAAQACSLNGASRVVVLLSTVNNPTGGRVGAQALSALRESLPKEVLLVVDDAYAEFSEVERPGDDALAVLRAGDEAVAAGGEGAHHWILLRTFAKAYGLAGLRVGYALGSSEEVAGVLHKVKGVFQVNAPAQAAALAALELGDAHLYEVRAHDVGLGLGGGGCREMRRNSRPRARVLFGFGGLEGPGQYTISRRLDTTSVERPQARPASEQSAARETSAAGYNAGHIENHTARAARAPLGPQGNALTRAVSTYVSHHAKGRAADTVEPVAARGRPAAAGCALAAHGGQLRVL